MSPLCEPGMIATWRFDVMGPPLRAAADHHASNLAEYYLAKLKVVGLDESGAVELKIPSGMLTLPLPEFRRWYRDYLFEGITVVKTADPKVGRLLIRPPGGGGPPIGWDDTLPVDHHRH
ncbi:MAG TPA: hypothetical protein VG712_00020 [Gemmatimonadales bacterium]|nr:hypothetical protein [Gemmatimonadales bacterium]